MQAVVGNAVYSQVMGGLGTHKQRSGITLHLGFATNLTGMPAAELQSPDQGPGSLIAAPLSPLVEVRGLQSASTASAFRVFVGRLEFRAPMGSVAIRASNGLFLGDLTSLAGQ